MSKKITVDEMAKLACKYGLTLADLQTIREVEAAGSGFLPDGRPKILFERHKFREYTGGVFNLTHPDISGKYSDPKHRTYYRGGAGEWTRFDKAQKLNREAAIKSTSWGVGQIMGFHYHDLGFATPQEFVNENFKDEAAQFEIMVKFIKNNDMLYNALKAKNWAKFARLYNGPKYAENEYDIKLADAHKKHSNATV